MDHAFAKYEEVEQSLGMKRWLRYDSWLARALRTLFPCVYLTCSDENKTTVFVINTLVLGTLVLPWLWVLPDLLFMPVLVIFILLIIALTGTSAYVATGDVEICWWNDPTTYVRRRAMRTRHAPCDARMYAMIVFLQRKFWDYEHKACTTAHWNFLPQVIHSAQRVSTMYVQFELLELLNLFGAKHPPPAEITNGALDRLMTINTGIKRLAALEHRLASCNPSEIPTAVCEEALQTHRDFQRRLGATNNDGHSSATT